MFFAALLFFITKNIIEKNLCFFSNATRYTILTTVSQLCSMPFKKKYNKKRNSRRNYYRKSRRKTMFMELVELFVVLVIILIGLLFYFQNRIYDVTSEFVKKYEYNIIITSGLCIVVVLFYIGWRFFRNKIGQSYEADEAIENDLSFDHNDKNEGMTPEKFEDMVASYLRNDGWKDVYVVGYRENEKETNPYTEKLGWWDPFGKRWGDGGIDIVGYDPQGLLTVIQVKMYSSNNIVRLNVAQNFVGAIQDFNTLFEKKVERSIIVATSKFTHPCRDFAERNNVELWDAKDMNLLG